MNEEEALRGIIKQLNAARDRLDDAGETGETEDLVSEAQALAEQELAIYGDAISAGEIMNPRPATQGSPEERRRQSLEQAAEALDAAIAQTRDAGDEGDTLGRAISEARGEVGRMLDEPGS